MNGAKHTPGPWVAHKYFGSADNYYIRGAGDERVLGGGAPLHGANARLISAAPDLLEALKDAMRSTRKDFDQPGAEGDRQHREAWAEQFAAIDKAEGRS